MRGSQAKRLAIGLAVSTLTLLAACSDDTSSPAAGTTTSPAAAGGTVEVTLQEFSVAAVPSSVGAGSVTFDVTNTGPEDVHEFVIIKTDLDYTALPTDEDGAVDEEGEGIEVVDEIEDIPVGDTQSVTADLDAGSYALICNILQTEPDGSLEAHYSEGMRTGFTVT
jgi:uncharacterized cupredoxin-like copper-binding protein